MILLDTHVLVWWLTPDKSMLPARISRLIDKELDSGTVAASSISAWEIALLMAKGKLQLSMDLHELLEVAAQIEGFEFLPLHPLTAARSVTLPGEFHSDPADRIIVSQARELGAPLVTADEKIRRYEHVRTIW